MRRVFLKVSLMSIVSFMLFNACIFHKEPWSPLQRVMLTIPEKLRIEYQNNGEVFTGDSQVHTPNLCVLVKDGDLYYVKVPTVYSSNRYEVMKKDNLQNPLVDFVPDSPAFAQSYITAAWVGGTNSWLRADADEASPNAPHWHANDENNHVYYVGISFLNHGYESINHPYDNGVQNSRGSKYTSTQLGNETLTIGSVDVECVAWEYEEYHAEDNWLLEKYWLEKDSNIVLKKNSIYSSNLVQNQNIDDDANTRFRATYFSKDSSISMNEHLSSIERAPEPDFSGFI